MKHRFSEIVVFLLVGFGGALLSCSLFGILGETKDVPNSVDARSEFPISEPLSGAELSSYLGSLTSSSLNEKLQGATEVDRILLRSDPDSIVDWLAGFDPASKDTPKNLEDVAYRLAVLYPGTAESFISDLDSKSPLLVALLSGLAERRPQVALRLVRDQDSGGFGLSRMIYAVWLKLDPLNAGLSSVRHWESRDDLAAGTV